MLKLIKKEKLIKILKSRFFAIAMVGIVSLVCGLYILSFEGVVEVFMNGESIGYVKSEAEFNEIKSAAKEMIYNNDFESSALTAKSVYVKKSAFKKNKTNTKEVIAVSGNYDQVCALFVDGKLTAFAKTEAELDNMLSDLVKQYEVEGRKFKAYANEVEKKTIYANLSSMDSLAKTSEEFLEGKAEVGVIVSVYTEYEESIAYKTETNYDSSKYDTYSVTTQSGVKGLKKVCANITYLNGEKQETEIIKTEVLKEPVNKKVTKGSKSSAAQSFKDKINIVPSPDRLLMIFPLEITKNIRITSYWGDGRNHKGMDLASPKGTKIYAAADGKVIFSGTKSGYGKCVIIEHYDGKTKTLYAHASALKVSKGDKVKAGDVVALVGSTGRSTGNHLHFEVRINDTPVNPIKYIGLQ